MTRQPSQRLTPEEVLAIVRTHFTHQEAAHALGISRATLRNWRQANRIRPIRPAAPWFYTKSEVLRLAGIEQEASA